mgnify:CR=1 FL=1
MNAAMHSQAMFFQARAGAQVRNAGLQKTLKRVRPLFVAKRAKGVAGLVEDGIDVEALRGACEAIRRRVVDDLDVWLEIFEARAKAGGAEVLWARDGEEVARLVVDIAQRHGVTKAVKSKSMLSEEAQLNAALTAAGTVMGTAS